MKREWKNLGSSLEDRLSGYALAAGAAGVSLLALAQSSEGRIVYTKTHRVIDHSHHLYLLHLNHGNTEDARISYFFTSSRGLYRRALVAAGSRVATVSVYTWNVPRRKRRVDLAFKPGSRIGFSRNFGVNTAAMAESSFNSGTICGGKNCYWGYWFNVTDRYLGFEFKIKGAPHFGWARLNVQTSNHNFIATLTGYAYETIPNKPIIAGKTHGKDVITVEPASLGHLARGASAIPAWRGEQ